MPKIIRILLVDDEPFNLYILEEIFKELDIKNISFIIDKAFHPNKAIEMICDKI
jgi:hypothetical protein